MDDQFSISKSLVEIQKILSLLKCTHQLNPLYYDCFSCSSHAHPRVRAEKKMSIREQDYQVGFELLINVSYNVKPMKHFLQCGSLFTVHQRIHFASFHCYLDTSSHPRGTSICRYPD